MTSEVKPERAVRLSAAELGALSAETETTREEETQDASSPGSGADIAGTTSGLASSAARVGVAGNSLQSVAKRLEENLCRSVEGEEAGDTRSGSGGDEDDLASRENPRDCSATQRQQQQQQLVPVSRSQYHSIQQLSRPSINVAVTHHRRPAACQLDNSVQLYRQADVTTAGRYLIETGGRSRDNNEARGEATECDRRGGDDDATGAHSDYADDCSACTDDRPTDADSRRRIEVSTTEMTGKAWSSATSQNDGGSGAVAAEGELEAKRARVEHIVRSMRTPPSDAGGGQLQSSIRTQHHQHQQQQQLIDGRRQRRKQFAPLQHQLDSRLTPHLKRSYVDNDDDDESRDANDAWGSQLLLDHPQHDVLRLGLQRVHDRLADMQQKYLKNLDESSEDDVIVDVGSDVKNDDEPTAMKHDDDDDDDDGGVIGADFNRNEILRRADVNGPTDVSPAAGSNIEALTRMLKAEISDSVGSMVDDIVRSFVAQRLKVAGAGSAGEWRNAERAGDGRLTPTHRSTVSTTSSPDTQFTGAPPPRTDTETVAPPPLCPSTGIDLLGFTVPPPVGASVAAAGRMETMERAAAAAAKLVAERYSLQSAAAMAAYLDNAFLLHGKTAFEMPPSHATATTHRLLNPTPYYPAQHPAALHAHLIKVSTGIVYYSFS